MSGHRIEFTIAPGDCTVLAVVRCDNDDTARCRQWCVEGCDEQCPGESEHKWAPTGSCNIADWLNNDGPVDCYEGDETTVRDGAISPHWNGDNFAWEYADVQSLAESGVS